MSYKVGSTSFGRHYGIDPDYYYVIDIEANGLLNEADRIWCIAFRPYGAPQEETQVWSYDDIYCPEEGETLDHSRNVFINPMFGDLLYDLTHCRGVIGHNIITYDWPLLKKLFEKEFSSGNTLLAPAKLIDTLVMSRVLNSDMPGGHSLANWMKKLKLKDKVSQEQWKVFDENMLVRCKEDTEATEMVFKELEQLSPSIINHDFLALEHEFASICHEITTNGISFDVDKCNRFIGELGNEIYQIDKVLAPKLAPIVLAMKPLVGIYKKDGQFTKKMNDWILSDNMYEIVAEGEDRTKWWAKRWITRESLPSSPNVLRNYLLSLGWKPRNDPEAWNYKQMKTPWGKLVKVKGLDGNPIRTSPKLPTDDKELAGLKEISPDFKYVAWRLERAHRLNTLNGYMKNYDKSTNRIHMGINPCGAVTTRVTHSVVANIPRVTSFFGEEMRMLFKASPGKVLVGCDMAGLELRVLAHYLNNKEFTDMILHGDVHTFIFEKLQDYVLERGDAKNLTYAFLYGGGNSKLGSMCNKVSNGNLIDLGKKVRAIYLEYIPNLKQLINRLEASFKTTGGFKAIDGRFIKCRNSYSALNTLCQSAGSILAKNWTCEYNKRRDPFCDNLIVYMHDELIVETTDERSVQVGETLVECIKLAGQKFKLNIELDGEYKIGQNWSEIH